MRHRPAAIVFICGAAVKACLIAMYEVADIPGLLSIITTYDPLSMSLANWAMDVLPFKGIAPAGAAETFDMLLVFAFGLQCMLLFYVGEVVRLRFLRRYPVDV